MTKRERLLELARRRAQSQWPGYRQPEDYQQYDFRDLVSPYSRTAGNLDADVMLVLQDWSSHDELSKGFDADIARYGHDPRLRTNIRLKGFLDRHLQLRLKDTYGTNLFPFIKPGGIRARIPAADLHRAAWEFALPQIDIVNPRVVVALGRRTADVLVRAGAPVLHVHHPAASKTNAEMDAAWHAVAEALAAAVASGTRAGLPPPALNHSILRMVGAGRSGGSRPGARDKHAILDR